MTFHFAASKATATLPARSFPIGATAVSAPVAMAGFIAGDDPIFAAIDRHRAAEVRYCAACKLTDEVAARKERRVITAADHAEFDAAELESDEALGAVIATTTPTVAGVRVFLRHCIDEDSVEEFLTELLETLLQSPVLSTEVLS